MQFKAAQRLPTPEIAKALNVDAVIEGSVARVGDKVRVTAQLIDAPAAVSVFFGGRHPEDRTMTPFKPGSVPRRGDLWLIPRVLQLERHALSPPPAAVCRPIEVAVAVGSQAGPR